MAENWTHEELEVAAKNMEDDGHVVIYNQFKCDDCGKIFTTIHPMEMNFENVECSSCGKMSANIIVGS